MTCLRYLEQKVAAITAMSTAGDRETGLIFCGDFNCTPPFGSYRLATGGKIAEDDEDWTSRKK